MADFSFRLPSVRAANGDAADTRHVPKLYGYAMVAVLGGAPLSWLVQRLTTHIPMDALYHPWMYYLGR